MLIVTLLGEGPQRFNELRRSIDGISQRMLTLTLRNLERDGLVSRTIEPTNPPRVEYALMPLGHSLLEPVMALAAWAGEHREAVHTARDHYDRTVRRGADGAGAKARPSMRAEEGEICKES